MHTEVLSDLNFVISLHCRSLLGPTSWLFSQARLRSGMRTTSGASRQRMQLPCTVCMSSRCACSCVDPSSQSLLPGLTPLAATVPVAVMRMLFLGVGIDILLPSGVFLSVYTGIVCFFATSIVALYVSTSCWVLSFDEECPVSSKHMQSAAY